MEIYFWTYLIFLLVSSLFLFWRPYGHRATHYLSLSGLVVFLLLIFPNSEIQFFNNFVLSGLPRNIFLGLGFSLLAIMLWTGPKNEEKVITNQILSFSLLGDLFLLNSDSFLMLFLSLEYLAALLAFAVFFSNKHFSRQAALKLFFSNGVIMTLFIIGISFFMAGTNSLNFETFDVSNIELFSFGIVCFGAVSCFKIGIFPFHFWVVDTFSNLKKETFFGILTIVHLPICYKLISILQKLVISCPPEIQETILNGVFFASFATIISGAFMAVGSKSLKHKSINLLLVQFGFLFLSTSIDPEDNYLSYVCFFLFTHALIATGIFILFDLRPSIRKVLTLTRVEFLFLTLFLFSMFGGPLTLGFHAKGVLLSKYFRDGFFLSIGFYLLCNLASIHVFGNLNNYINIDEHNNDSNVITLKRDKIILTIISTILIIGGIYPSLFLAN